MKRLLRARSSVLSLLSVVAVVTAGSTARAQASGDPADPSVGDPTEPPPPVNANPAPSSTPPASSSDPAAPGSAAGTDPRGGPPSDPGGPPPPRREPVAAPPANPLEMSAEVRMRIGSDSVGAPFTPEGTTQRSFHGYYESTQGDSRLRTLPPLWIEHTRGLPDPSRASVTPPGELNRESLYGLLYYQRRSPKVDADILFPAFWNVRTETSTTTIVGPFVHRTAREAASDASDNWVAPLFFSGTRKDGGYFHAPLLLTTTHTSPHGAFTLVGPYFRDRTEQDIDFGVAPFYFHGDNGDIDGNRRDYTLIPPLLTYRSWHELDSQSTTVVGPIIYQHNPKRTIVDVAPLFFHIEGNPETGGITESHTTLLPLFHYGRTADSSLFVVPGYMRRITPTADTMITPLFSEATTRRRGTRLRLAGPVVPLFYDYADRDIDVHAWAIAPFYYQSTSPRGRDFLTPLVGRFETYGVSRTYWALPSITITNGIHGFDYDLHPILYFGRTDDSSHTVIAPFFWDFASPRGRSTVAFPVFWRFTDTEGNHQKSVTQLAGNTLYLEKKVQGGSDWSFHVLPLFSYGEDPKGYFWNVLFGLAGYTREAERSFVRAFWIPVQVSGPSSSPAGPGTAPTKNAWSAPAPSAPPAVTF